MSKHFAEDFLSSGTLIGIDKERFLIGWSERTWLSEPENEELPYFYFPDYFLKAHKPWFKHSHWEEVDRTFILNMLHPFLNRHSAKLSWTNIHQENFHRTFNELQHLFSNQELLKAVPYVFETSSQHMTHEILAHAIINLVNHVQSDNIYSYGFWDSSEGILGGTPEILFRLDNAANHLSTMACAGTTLEHSVDFVHDVKELYEHRLVIKGIVESLSPLCKGIETGKMGIRQFCNLHHLVTPIQAELKEAISYESLVKAMHPTPALGAFPKDLGHYWLLDYDKEMKRKRFGAPVGYLQGNIGTCLVAIRNMQWDATGIQIGAGCGVVANSLCEKEWQEIQGKIRAIKTILGVYE